MRFMTLCRPWSLLNQPRHHSDHLDGRLADHQRRTHHRQLVAFVNYMLTMQVPLVFMVNMATTTPRQGLGDRVLEILEAQIEVPPAETLFPSPAPAPASGV